MRFTKMQGLGNDYLFIDGRRGLPEDLPELSRRMSDRHFGAGSDGIICVCPSDKADFRMRMFNADGSEGKMCGNGIRCFGKYVYDQGMTEKTRLSVETLAGLRYLELEAADGRAVSVTADMGVPAVGAPWQVQVLGRSYQVIPVSMGNPHGVVFLDSIAELDLHVLGPAFERSGVYTEDGGNTEFALLRTPEQLEVRVWERGSGETMACGTGACASLAAAASAGLAERRARVRMPGGLLEVRWEADGHIYLTGPAVTVYHGEWPEEGAG